MTGSTNGLPPGPDSRPAMQMMRWLFRPIPFLEDCRRSFGETFSVTFPGFETPMVMTSEPEAIKAIYSNRENGLPPGRSLFIEPVMGPRSILLLEGKEHLARRKLMLPPFHGERMRAYETVIEEIAQDEIDSWPIDSAFAIHPRMQAMTLEVILRAVFGVSDAARLARLRALLGRALAQTSSPMLQIAGLATRRFGDRGPWGRFKAVLNRTDELLLEEIGERRSDPDLEDREDILSLLLVARFEDGEPMTDREVRDQLMTLLLAGHETTATGLAWTFELLLRNPATLGRLRDEIADGQEDYLRAVIAESLRLRPVVPIAGRRLSEEVKVGDWTLAAGTDVTPAIYLTHTRPDLYPEPKTFRPERFLEEGPDTYAWIPFGGGVRRCLGASFAEFEMRVVLRAVISRCELGLARSEPERVARRNITFSPRHGTPVVLASRRPAARPDAAVAAA